MSIDASSLAGRTDALGIASLTGSRPMPTAGVRRRLETDAFRLILLITLACFALWPHPIAAQQWQTDAFAAPRFVVSGTESRNNPIRRLLQPARGEDEVYFRMRLKYEADSVDTPADGDGEFLVFWMDASEGGATSTHSNGIPNFGLHTDGDRNRFVVRFHSRDQRFGPELEGDREYLLVARLSKSNSGHDQPYDALALWVDPDVDQREQPDATAHHVTSLHEVRWVGISTGRKTEFDDRIHLRDLEVAETWRQILGLPPEPDPEPSRAALPPEPTVSFREDVYPLLKEHCLECHSGPESESGIRLDRFDEVLNQTTPREAAHSRLYQVIANGEMPPSAEQLPPKDVQTLADWIDEGLAWDESCLPSPRPKSTHWAFQPIVRPQIPEVENAAWVRTPVDAFIAARHEAAGVVPNPSAPVATLNRRMCLDLLGLPPQPRPHDAAFSVDELLANPAYGERFARHWLDVARWAESNGHQHNRDRPHAWRYRDWVVQAFNRGLPYDEFLTHQIAGDLVRPYEPDQLIATGFLAAARYSGNELDKQIQRNDILVDVANTTASAFLGLTLGCAQCHSHKFDPLSIRDYYRFQAFFAQGQPGNVVLHPDPKSQHLIQRRWELFESVRARLVRNKRKRGHPEPIYVIPKAVRGGMKPAERKQFQALEREIAALDQSWAYLEPARAAADLCVAPHEMRWPLPRAPESLARIEPAILIRGDVNVRGPRVHPGWPLLFRQPSGATSDRSRSRLELARWMTHPDQPLTARVWVNRLWQWHFGKGLVETSNDFGTQGTRPTHPQLLDYLASELIDHDWDTRRIHRLIVDSSTYRQSSDHHAANAARDPDNRLWWRWTPRRLDAETIRDSVLAVSGHLERRTGGPSVEPHAPRRSLYLRQKRDHLPPQTILFDGPDGLTSCPRRRTSTNALQPLWSLNSDFMQSAARRLAERTGDVENAVRRTLHRRPTASERQQLEALTRQHGLASACLALLNSSEFMYLP